MLSLADENELARLPLSLPPYRRVSFEARTVDRDPQRRPYDKVGVPTNPKACEGERGVENEQGSSHIQHAAGLVFESNPTKTGPTKTWPEHW